NDECPLYDHAKRRAVMRLLSGQTQLTMCVLAFCLLGASALAATDEPAPGDGGAAKQPSPRQLEIEILRRLLIKVIDPAIRAAGHPAGSIGHSSSLDTYGRQAPAGMINSYLKADNFAKNAWYFHTGGSGAAPRYLSLTRDQDGRPHIVYGGL